jgi:hypothetical protein
MALIQYITILAISRRLMTDLRITCLGLKLVREATIRL